MLDAATLSRPKPLVGLNLQDVGVLTSRPARTDRRGGSPTAMSVIGLASVIKGLVRSYGSCSCGWRGGHHVVSALAVHDALVHAAGTRCRPAVPLVA